MNVLKSHKRISVLALLESGVGQREIERRLGVSPKTTRRYQRLANSPGVATGSGAADGQTPPPPATGSEPPASQTPAPRPPAPASASTTSACEAHRSWIESQVLIGRNAVAIYQDLVESHGFAHRYNSVKRFVARLKSRAPERFDVLEFAPGEEAQVDYGEGAPTLDHRGRYRKPALFVMTLKYSGKSFRKAMWKTDQESWSRAHEEAFRAFGGCPRYVVLDNLKQGVIKPDLYEPELNPVYAAMLAHYGVVADPCRVADPDRKGTVESAIGHTQGTALKGRRFESIEAQNAWLAHWEERWAAPRIHGRKKRQVLEMFREEQASLKPLPAEGFRCFRQVVRTVDDGGLVQVEGSYYAALPAPPHGEVIVRVYEREVEILDRAGEVLRRHAKSLRKGAFVMEGDDRTFNPSREIARLLARLEAIGPATAQAGRELFARLGRPGSRAIYGLANLVRKYPCADIEAVCARLMQAGSLSYAAVKRVLERQVRPAETVPLTQAHPAIRDLTEYQTLWEALSQVHHEDPDGNVYH